MFFLTLFKTKNEKLIKLNWNNSSIAVIQPSWCADGLKMQEIFLNVHSTNPLDVIIFVLIFLFYFFIIIFVSFNYSFTLLELFYFVLLFTIHAISRALLLKLQR